MQIDENDPLFSDWSNSWNPAEPFRAISRGAQSLAPYEVPSEDAAYDYEEDDLPPQVSPAHRRKLQQYVQATMAVCTLVCLAAVVRVGVSRAVAAAENEVHPVAASAEVTAAAPAHPEAATANAPPPTVAQPSSVGGASSSPHASPPSMRRATAAPPAAPLGAPKTAAQEREAARRALEHGKPHDAVAAAERATASDPTDAEAWLILGAANQELGHGGAAHQAFASCVRSAKRGPVRECSSMLR